MSGKKPTHEPVWRETPFAIRNVTYTLKDSITPLPFSVGGVTQHGPQHFRDNINNQDVMAIAIDDNFIAAVVCDGCTGSHPELKREWSNNETGAKLLARFAIEGIKSLIGLQKNISNDEFIANLQCFVIDKLNAVANILSSNEEEKKYVVSDFFMTTILGFVVTEDDYIVFHSGDGYIAVNDLFSKIDDDGVYLSKLIMCPDESVNFIKIFGTGKTSELKNIVLASDGCRSLIENHKQTLINYMNDVDKLLPGYDPTVLKQFRSKVIWNDAIKNVASQDIFYDDDATIIVLRKLVNTENGCGYAEN